MSRIAITSAFLIAVLAHQGIAESNKPQRAKLPAAETLKSDIFFQDAFREALRGPRPSALGANRATKSLASTNNEEKNNGTGKSKGFAWSNLVSASSLEDAVKSIQIQTQKELTTPGKFRGGGYLEARRLFTELAVLFAVIQEYDRDVRWREYAALARDRFTRAAANTKTTSIQAYNESQKRKQDLEELVRGGSLVAERKVDDETDWSLINRAALMKRFTTSYDEGLAIWTANETSFEKHANDIRRESELLTMFARVLTQEGMEDGDDEDYVNYSRRLEKAASDMLTSIQDKDARSAGQAASAIGQACVACHEDYRG